MQTIWLKDAASLPVASIGTKASFLAHLHQANIAIPHGFIITTEAFQQYLKEANLLALLQESSESHQQRWERVKLQSAETPVPTSVQEAVRESYQQLTVDQSISGLLNRQTFAFLKAGRDPTYVSIRSSTPEPCETVTFLNIKGEISVVDAMKRCWSAALHEGAEQPKICNVAVLIQKMVNADKGGVAAVLGDKVIIRAAKGFGEVVAKGLTGFDSYLVDAKNLQLLEKRIQHQEFMIIRDPQYGKNVRRQLVDGSAQKMNEYEVKRIAQLALRVADTLKQQVVFEFACDGDKVYVLNVRELTQEDLQQQEQPIVTQQQPIVERIIEKRENGHQGIITRLLVVPSLQEPVNLNADGIGLLAAEQLVAENPLALFAQGQREEYIEKLASRVTEIAQQLPTKEVWYRLLAADATFFQEGEKNPLLGLRGVRRSLAQRELLTAELAAIKQVHDAGRNNVGLLVPFVTDVKQIQDLKKAVGEAGFEPCEEIPFGIMIDTPAAVQIAKDLCDAGLDLVMIDLDMLAQLSLGLDRENPSVQALFDVKHKGVLKQVRDVVKTCKECNVEVGIVGTLDDEVLEFLVKLGLDDIVVLNKELDRTRSIVHRAEKKLLLSVARQGLSIGV